MNPDQPVAGGEWLGLAGFILLMALSLGFAIYRARGPCRPGEERAWWLLAVACTVWLIDGFLGYWTAWPFSWVSRLGTTIAAIALWLLFRSWRDTP